MRKFADFLLLMAISSKLRNMAALPQLLKGIRPILWLVMTILYLLSGVPSYAASSANYQLDSDQVLPNQFRQSSGSYTVDGSIEPIVGSVTSGTYGQEVGSPLRIETTPTPGGGGGGGGVGSSTRWITVDNANCPMAYKTLLPLNGRKTSNVIYMTLNDSMAGFYFPTERSWENTVWLQPGINQLRFVGRTAQNIATDPVNVTILKLRMGDINQNGFTDDYDLSMLSRKWNVTGDCPTDLNSDGITDDYDLSLLASSWSN